jgi:hypothetical protein
MGTPGEPGPEPTSPAPCNDTLSAQSCLRPAATITGSPLLREGLASLYIGAWRHAGAKRRRTHRALPVSRKAGDRILLLF